MHYDAVGTDEDEDDDISILSTQSFIIRSLRTTHLVEHTVWCACVCPDNRQ